MMFIIPTFHFMIRAITYYTFYNLEGWRSMLRVLTCFVVVVFFCFCFSFRFFFFFFFFFFVQVCVLHFIAS